MAERFRSAHTLSSYGMAATIALTANQFNKLGEYVVKAGEVISIGVGSISSMSDAIGRIYARFADNSASPGVEIKGTLRLSIYSPQDRPRKILWEMRSNALNTVSNDRPKQTPLPIGIEDVYKDQKLVLEFKPDASATVALANSVLEMDITQGVS